MGVLEQQHRKRRRKNEIQRAILCSLAVTGIVAVAVMAPNALTILRHIPGWREGARSREVIKRSQKRLIEKGYMTVRGGFAELTEAGRIELARYASEDPTSRPRRWDTKWRMLVFDIPDYRKSDRDKLRYMLIRYGFVRLQQSVWVFPYDCEDMISLLKTDMQVGNSLLYVIADSIENDRWLMKRFKLGTYKR